LPLFDVELEGDVGDWTAAVGSAASIIETEGIRSLDATIETERLEIL